jgi:hypothetical protein
MPPQLFKPLPGDAQYWESLRDGYVDNGTSLQVNFTCELIKTWQNTKTGHVFTQGMAGTVIAFNAQWVKIGFQGIKSPKDIPRSCVRGGPVKNGLWTMQGHDLNLRIAPPSAKDVDMKQQLPKAIRALLLTIKDCKAPYLTWFIEEVGEAGENADGITKRIVGGVRQAGLLETFNKPKFTVQDIERNANLRIGFHQASQQCGIYIRIYKTKDGKVMKVALYIGKSKNFMNRYTVVKGLNGPPGSAQNKHWELHNSDSTTVIWCALCILPGVTDRFLFMAEQVFTSLLETYRSDIASPSPADLKKEHLSTYIADAAPLVKAADGARKLTKWPGGVSSRPTTFGATSAMNIQTALTETSQDRTQWIREDTYAELSTGEIIQVANFRRTAPKRAHYRLDKGVNYRIDWLKIYWVVDGKNKDWVVTSNFTKSISITKGVNTPIDRSIYNTVIEVRLDGKPHPKSYMRGPKIPIFLNSEIANSWALRAEWKDASGQPRQRYLQYGDGRNNDKVLCSEGAARGQWDHYLNAIAMVHFLFGQTVQNPRSVYRIWGHANVLQAHHNYLMQEVVFGPQTLYANVIDYSRIPDKRIVDMMVANGLENVNASFVSQRPNGKCDGCELKLVNRDADQPCVQKQGVAMEVCGYCYDILGRPACSWTPHPRNRADTRNLHSKFRLKARPLLTLAEFLDTGVATDTVDADSMEIPTLVDDEHVSDDELDV